MFTNISSSSTPWLNMHLSHLAHLSRSLSLSPYNQSPSPRKMQPKSMKDALHILPILLLPSGCNNIVHRTPHLNGNANHFIMHNRITNVKGLFSSNFSSLITSDSQCCEFDYTTSGTDAQAQRPLKFYKVVFLAYTHLYFEC